MSFQSSSHCIPSEFIKDARVHWHSGKVFGPGVILKAEGKKHLETARIKLLRIGESE